MNQNKIITITLAISMFLIFGFAVASLGPSEYGATNMFEKTYALSVPPIIPPGSSKSLPPRLPVTPASPGAPSPAGSAGSTSTSTTKPPIVTDIGSAANMGEYMTGIFAWGMPIIGSLAVLMFIYAGYLYMTSQGNQESITKAKDIITGVIIGLLLLFTAEVILRNVIGTI